MHRHRTSTTTASIEDLHLLWGDATGSERCGTKVLDTVLFRDARPTRWLFTNKHSQVAKKKDGNLKLDRIHDRFLRLANVRGCSITHARVLSVGDTIHMITLLMIFQRHTDRNRERDTRQK